MNQPEDRESLADEALALAQNPDLAFNAVYWCGRHLAVEDLAELVQFLGDCRLSMVRTAAARNAEIERLRATSRPE